MTNFQRPPVEYPVATKNNLDCPLLARHALCIPYVYTPP